MENPWQEGFQYEIRDKTCFQILRSIKIPKIKILRYLNSDFPFESTLRS